MSKVCAVAGCDRKLHAHGWCATHWRRWKRFGDPLAELPPRRKANRTCSLPDCDRPHHGQGFCARHLKRYAKHGDTEARKPGKPYEGRSREAVEAVLLQRRTITESGCWEYTRPGHYGYGYLSLRGKQQLTHRLAWTFWRGEIPAGLCVLHRCDNPPCFNPEHLFLGTIAENNADMDAKGRRRTVVHSGDDHWTRKQPERRKAKITAEDVRAIRASADIRNGRRRVHLPD